VNMIFLKVTFTLVCLCFVIATASVIIYKSSVVISSFTQITQMVILSPTTFHSAVSKQLLSLICMQSVCLSSLGAVVCT
jgi:hypothetical protein